VDGPFLTMVIVGAFRLHAETGPMPPSVKMTGPPGPRQLMLHAVRGIHSARTHITIAWAPLVHQHRVGEDE